MKRLLLLISLCPGAISAGNTLTGYGAGSISTTLGSGSIVRASAAAPGVAPQPCEGTFFSDTFTESGTGNINLSASLPDISGLWIGTPASDGSLLVDRSADEVLNTNTGGAFKVAYWNLSPDCADYAVTSNAKTGVTGSSHRVGVRGRYNGGTDSGYGFRIGGDARCYLEKIVNGTVTDLVSSVAISGFSGSTYYDIELRVIGSTVSGYINGVLKLTVTDTTYADAGTVGIFLRNGYVRLTSVSAYYP